MDDENRNNQADTDPDPSCSWSQQSQNSDSIANTYFFGNTGGSGGGVRHTNLFTDFGWNLPIFQQDERHGYGVLDRIAGNNLTNPTASVSASFSASDGGGSEVEPQRMVSSSSSEDKGEKSTASGGSTSRPPSDTTASKVKKKGQKRVRQPRFAFMTKSEVDHLEDGYRWRKYGQKAVKNSPYPRSYYRCTNTKCTVKKRVERSSEDPTTVITTYEGQHCHHTVGFPRNTSLIINPEITFSAPSITTPSSSPQMYYPAALGMHFSPHSAAAPINSDRSFRYTGEGGESHSLPVINPRSPSTDEGLLGDIVPHGMRNS